MATLTVTRPHYYPDWLRAYKLLVDGRVVGKIRAGETVEMDVAQGAHVLQARIDWCRSRSLSINVGAKGMGVTVRSGLQGWKVLLVLAYITFLRTEYLVLEEGLPANRSLQPTPPFGRSG